jgi:hypothetical protein
MLFLRSRRRLASLRRARSLTRPLTLESVNYARCQFGIARFNCQSVIDLCYIARMTTFACMPYGSITAMAAGIL